MQIEWNLIQMINLNLISLAKLILICMWLLSMQQNQAVSIKHYGTNHGLSSSSVNHIFQDSDGMLWVATETDVHWFNGTSFKDVFIFTNVLSDWLDSWLSE